ncbi:patatin-like phospholipase family protein [Robiginitalea aurantiaca]|uniref:Patatin-like phospholipase family protein n=1 Tax=Robiginitalea aurantiaca TaxID=3056915 RepID=A0ABT7WH88_9FLAO|nr:patatin-like phospholipase family protein [Robiginitalea aurantiaca]MDM9632284.1 patatin-like phospholipase family protein [Robiginitalea aurantiaca]
MKIALTLSGGGYRGIAHVGVLKALEEAGIKPEAISGTSAGAVVGALYANGMSTGDMLNFFKSIQLFSIGNLAFGKPGWVDPDSFYDRFRKIFPADDFAALKIPLQVTATDILNGELKIFSEGPLIKALLASAAFPGFFAPVEVGKGYYVDGGVLNNFPVDLLREEAEFLIGVYVTPFGPTEKSKIRHSISVLDRVLKIKSATDSIRKFDMCDMLVYPKELGRFSTFLENDLDTIFELGYQEAKKSIEEASGSLPVS